MDTPEDLLQLLFSATLQELLTRIRNGEASASDLGVAAKMLKDNNITADIGKNDALRDLRDQLAKRQQKNIDSRSESNKLAIPTTDEEKQMAIDEFTKRLIN